MSEYNTNQDGQWKTSDQWRAEEANDHSNPKKNKNGGRGKYVAKLAASAVAFGLIAGLVMQGVTYGFSRAGIGNGATQLATTKTTSSSSSTSSNDLSGVSKNVMPSIVSITGKFETTSQSWFGQTQNSESEGVGSGIIIGKKDGKILIVTNNHVVEGNDTLTVSFIDEESVEANVKGTNAAKDLAVVAVKLSDIKDSTMDAIAVATLGDSTQIQVGEPAIAIGNALGYGQSVTTGIISATNRELNGFDGKLIQTDAAINPGNSGGALLNAKGEVIGINSAKVATDTVEGMGYAIPISDASDIITNLMNQKTKTKVAENERGYIGIQGVDVTADSAEMYNMPTGVYVSEVISGGAAQKAGISKGAVITGLDGTEINSMSTLQEQLQYYKAGEKVTLTVQTPGKNGEYEKNDVEVTLGTNAQ